ncbi:MAG: phage tail tape measure protein [Solirubrobacteraceae bacterium]|nr:phage tail tape measure protein [Solirubrobacteraceae bacterium]
MGAAVGRAAKIGGAALLGAGAAATKIAVSFESSFAGVRKTVDASEAEFSKLSKGLRAMSREIPVTANEMAGIAEAAGQLGIETKNILGFSRTMADLGVATNMSSDQAATSLARLANITQMPQTEFDRLGSTIVELGNNLATTEGEIVEMGLRLAGAGKQVGMTEDQILSFGGALSSVGIAAEAGGSAFSRVFVDMAVAVQDGDDKLDLFAKTAGMTGSEFQRAFEKDASGATIAFIEGLGKIKDSGGDVFGTLKDLGFSQLRVRDSLLRASGAGDLFRRSMKLGSQAWKENNALTKEAEQRYDTTESKLKILKNVFTDTGIVLGSKVLPPLADAAQAMASFVSNAIDGKGPIGDLKDQFDGLRDSGSSVSEALRTMLSDGFKGVNWDKIGGTISDGFTKGVDFTGKLAPAVASGIGTALGQIDGRQLLSGLLRVVSESIEALLSPSFWKENFAAIFSTVTIVFPVAKILKIPGAKWLYDHISKPFYKALGFLGKGLLSSLGKIGSEAGVGFLAGLEKLAPRTAHLLLGLVTGTGKWLSGLPGKFKDGGRRAVDGLVGAIGDGIGKLTGGIGRLIGAGIKKLGSLVPDWVRVGTAFAGAMIRGVVNGIKALPGKIGGAVKGALGAVTGSGIVNKLFGDKGDGIGRALGSSMPSSGGGGNLMGANPALGPIAGLAARLGGKVSSGRRPGAITSSGNQSYHSSGEAIDIVGTPGNMLRIFRALKATMGPRLAELIYTPGGTGIRNGRPHRFTGKVAADHLDHVHAALDLGKPGPGIGDGYGKGQIMNLWTRAGGSPGIANLAAAVALAESGGNSKAMNRNTNGSVDRGLWQINSIHGALSTFDPTGNAKAAVKISSGGRNWNPWVAFKRGMHLKFLGAPAGNVGGGSGTRSTGGSGGAAAVSAHTERAGSRIVNALTKRHSPAIDRAVGAAARTGTLIEDASTAYGHMERRFNQTDEDLSTAAGREQRLSEIAALKQEKSKQLARAKRRAAHLKTAVSRLNALIKQARKQRDKARGATRARIAERIRNFEDRRTDLAAELKGLQLQDIPDLELDLGDLTKEARQVASTPDAEGPSPTDLLSQHMSDIDLQERAGVITPATANALRGQALQAALAGAWGALDQRQQWDVMGQQRELQQAAIDAQQANTQAANEVAQALRDVKASIDQQNAIANSTIGIQLREATRALGDLIGGELGHRAGNRSMMPGSGQLSRL